MAKTKDVALHCSFCAQPSTKVDKLIAGPGVYICDVCVALCDDILRKEVAADFAKLQALDDDALLVKTAEVHRAVHAVSESVQQHIAELRSRGVTWQRIGDALGISRQAAWERFSGED